MSFRELRSAVQGNSLVSQRFERFSVLGSGGVSKALDVGRKGHGFHLVAPASLLYLGE